MECHSKFTFKIVSMCHFARCVCSHPGFLAHGEPLRLFFCTILGLAVRTFSDHNPPSAETVPKPERKACCREASKDLNRLGLGGILHSAQEPQLRPFCPITFLNGRLCFDHASPRVSTKSPHGLASQRLQNAAHTQHPQGWCVCGGQGSPLPLPAHSPIGISLCPLVCSF